MPEDRKTTARRMLAEDLDEALSTCGSACALAKQAGLDDATRIALIGHLARAVEALNDASRVTALTRKDTP